LERHSRAIGVGGENERLQTRKGIVERGGTKLGGDEKKGGGDGRHVLDRKRGAYSGRGDLNEVLAS